MKKIRRRKKIREIMHARTVVQTSKNASNSIIQLALENVASIS